jgi:hypothetical protein
MRTRVVGGLGFMRTGAGKGLVMKTGLYKCWVCMRNGVV